MILLILKIGRKCSTTCLPVPDQKKGLYFNDIRTDKVIIGYDIIEVESLLIIPAEVTSQDDALSVNYG